MTIVGLIIFLLVVGAVLALVPMEGTIKRAVVIIVVLVAALWLLSAFGIFGGRTVAIIR